MKLTALWLCLILVMSFVITDSWTIPTESGSFEFDGSDDLIQVGNVGYKLWSDTWTLCMYLYIEQVSGARINALCFTDSNNKGWGLFTRNEDMGDGLGAKYRFTMEYEATSGQSLTVHSSKTVIDYGGKWVAVVYTCNGSSSGYEHNFYFDGIIDLGDHSTDPLATATYSDASVLQFGARNDTTPIQFWDGRIGPTAIYSVVLSTPEINDWVDDPWSVTRGRDLFWPMNELYGGIYELENGARATYTVGTLAKKGPAL